MRALIAGCGDLGTEIGLRFADQGYTVVGLRRCPEVLPSAIAGLRCDLADEQPPIPPDTHVVVMATSPDARTHGAYEAAYVRSLSHLLDGLDETGITPDRMILISSTAVYGVDDGSWINEDSTTEPETVTAAVLLDAERLLHARMPTATVFRLAGLYGPGRTRLIDQARTNTTPLSPNIQYTNRIHRDDAAAAVVHLASTMATPAALYLGADNEPATRSDVTRFVADELAVPPVATDENGRETASAGTKLIGKKVDNRRLRNSGFTFTYPTYRQGYRAVLAGNGIRHP